MHDLSHLSQKKNYFRNFLLVRLRPGQGNFSNRNLKSTTDTLPRTSQKINFSSRTSGVYCKGNHFSDSSKVYPNRQSSKETKYVMLLYFLRSDHRNLNWLKEQMYISCGVKRCHHTRLCAKQFAAKIKKIYDEVVQMSTEEKKNICRLEPSKVEQTVSTT